MRNIAIPDIRERLPPFVWFGWGEWYAATIVGQGKTTVGKLDKAHARCVFLGCGQIIFWQRTDRSRPDLDAHIGGHLPKIPAFKQSDHSIGHKGAIVLPVRGCYHSSR